jgi:hypothetical protein
MEINFYDLPKDIVDRVSFEYEKGNLEEVFILLTNLNEDMKNCRHNTFRILRCVIFLSSRSVEHIKYYCEMARSDFRDVMYWAEYDKFDNRLRDFNMEFSYNNGY